MSRRKTKINKSQKDQLDLYKDYEPDGKDLAEWMSNDEQDPNYDPEDHWASLETDKMLGK